QIADVADRKPTPQVRLGRLLLVAVVAEALASRLEVDGARHVGRHVVAVIVEDVHLYSFDRTADGARLLQPPPRLRDGPRALGATIGLPDDGPPPIHHLLFHIARTRRGGMHDRMEAAQVIPLSDLVG